MLFCPWPVLDLSGFVETSSASLDIPAYRLAFVLDFTRSVLRRVEGSMSAVLLPFGTAHCAYSVTHVERKLIRHSRCSTVQVQVVVRNLRSLSILHNLLHPP